MVMKVYGSMISTATLRVLVCLAEKDIDFELIHVDLASGEHKKPHLLSINVRITYIISFGNVYV